MTPRQGELLRLLQRHPEGLKLTDIMTTMGRTFAVCSADLRALKAIGLVSDALLDSVSATWATTGDLVALRAKRKAEVFAQASARRKSKKPAAEDEPTAEFIRPSIKRWLNQSEWVGHPTPGICSVFHMGCQS